jgi:hypothetical protein
VTNVFAKHIRYLRIEVDDGHVEFTITVSTYGSRRIEGCYDVNTAALGVGGGPLDIVPDGCTSDTEHGRDHRMCTDLEGERKDEGRYQNSFEEHDRMLVLK